MLKIKDNVDLKELEKLGFTEIKEEHHFYYKLIKEYWIFDGAFKELVYIIIDLSKNGKIKLLKVQIDPILKFPIEQKIKRCPRKLIKNLIQAGLAEKV